MNSLELHWAVVITCKDNIIIEEIPDGRISDLLGWGKEVEGTYLAGIIRKNIDLGKNYWLADGLHMDGSTVLLYIRIVGRVIFVKSLAKMLSDAEELKKPCWTYVPKARKNL